MSDSREFDAALDALNAELAETGAWLCAQGFRTPARVPLPSGGHLAWGKRSGDYEFIYVPEHGAEMPLTRTSIARRIEGADAAPALVEALRAAQIDTLESVRRATSALRSLRRSS